jgi:hypothetical protein
MRTSPYLLSLVACALVVGCGRSEARRRAEYVHATLPFDATMVVSAATALREENPNSKALGFLDEAVRVDLLRLQVCLADPAVPEKDKTFARGVYQKLVSYAAQHDVAVGYQPGHVYTNVPFDDIALPHEMVIRDAIDEAIKHQK